MEPETKTQLFVVTRALALLFAAVCLVMGALELILNSDAGGVLFLLLGASGVAILLGVSAQRRSPLLAAVLVSAGAAFGGLVLAWTVLAPLVALVLIVLSVLLARELTT